MSLIVAGDLPLGESNRACGLIRRRVLGWRRLVPVLCGLALGLLICVGASILDDLGAPAWSIVLAAPLAFIAGMRGVVRLCGASANKALRDRGAAASQHVTYEVLPEGLRVCSEVAFGVYYWSGIDELARSRDHWVVLVLGLGLVLPRRFFATPDAEQTFIRALWEKMDPEARARSTQAATFLALT